MTPSGTETIVPLAETERSTGHSPKDKLSRLVSLDAYRGFVMLLMASEGLNLARVARSFPDNPFWQFLAYQTEHVDWRGCALWDLIQPSFMFMVGVAMPFSLASRQAKGQTFNQLLRHAIWRSLLLIFLGIFLRSIGKHRAYFTFEDVLTQIGLGYTFLFLIAWFRPKIQLGFAFTILVLYWAAFALYPLPSPDLDFKSVGVPQTWQHLQGFAQHWDKNTNFAAAFDQWFLNLFPREKPFVFNGGGYLTLNFVPSLATMIFGLLIGNLMRKPSEPGTKVKFLVGAGVGGLLVGMALDWTGICPSVKRIWTPSWAIFSTGWTCILLALFYGVIDWKGRKKWAFPLVVVGMNSIAMYMMAHLFGDLVNESLRIVGMDQLFRNYGTVYAPIFQAAAALGVLWLVCFWMYRRKLFLRI
jgi:heparan-alpha-glucosaminide N-acetyltransferase